MIPYVYTCPDCGAGQEIRTYRKFIVCTHCGSKHDFPGFDYRVIDWNSSMYAGVKYTMDCPACRGPNMYLGLEKRAWLCPDCGYSVSRLKKMTGVFWFCDDCEAFLNVQDGFTTKDKVWKCTECGCLSGVSRRDII